MSSDTIVVTGFGPFGLHTINASWEAVKLLPNQQINAEKVIIEEIPVEYKYIDEVIPHLWKLYDPKLVVHVGVSEEDKKIRLETRAFRSGYQMRDCTNNTHPTGEVCLAKDNKDCIETELDVEAICMHINSSNMYAAYTSENAGRYLCEYTFYKSLSINEKRTLFVHVPMLNKPYNAEQLALALVLVINCALKQLGQVCAGSFVEEELSS